MNDTRSAVGSVEATVRDFWTSRPVRPATGGKLGGVAAAVGNRYGIDPVLLRVAFVVAALYGGSGVLLYLLGWMFLPREEQDASGQVSTRTTSTLVLVVLAVLLIPALYALRNLPGLIGTVVGCLALYLLHRNRAEHGSGEGGPSGGGPSGGPSGSAGSAAATSGGPTPGAPTPGAPTPGGAGPSGPAAEVTPPGSTSRGDSTSLADAAQTPPGTSAPDEVEGTRAEPTPAETTRVESAVTSTSGSEVEDVRRSEAGIPRPEDPQAGNDGVSNDEERGTEERGTEEAGTEEAGTEEAGTEEGSSEEAGTEEGSAAEEVPRAGGSEEGSTGTVRLDADTAEPGAATPGAAEADTDRFTARQPPAIDPWSAPRSAGSHAEPPAPPGPAPERPRFDRMLTPVTLLLAALTVAGGLYLSYDPTTILAATLGVLGLGMLVGSVLRRGRVLVLLAVPVAVLTVLAAGATPHRNAVVPEPASDTDRHVVLTTAAEANQARTLEAGNLTLDLRGMPPQEAEKVHHVQAQTGAGGVTVHVPADWGATAHCSSWAGTVNCLGTERSGTPARETVTESGEDARNGRPVTITAHTGTGYVEVRRD